MPCTLLTENTQRYFSVPHMAVMNSSNYSIYYIAYLGLVASAHDVLILPTLPGRKMSLKGSIQIPVHSLNLNWYFIRTELFPERQYKVVITNAVLLHNRASHSYIN